MITISTAFRDTDIELKGVLAKGLQVYVIYNLLLHFYKIINCICTPCNK
jgi:hypothetical protein